MRYLLEIEHFTHEGVTFDHYITMPKHYKHMYDMLSGAYKGILSEYSEHNVITFTTHVDAKEFLTEFLRRDRKNARFENRKRLFFKKPKNLT